MPKTIIERLIDHYPLPSEDSTPSAVGRESKEQTQPSPKLPAFKDLKNVFTGLSENSEEEKDEEEKDEAEVRVLTEWSATLKANLTVTNLQAVNDLTKKIIKKACTELLVGNQLNPQIINALHLNRFSNPQLPRMQENVLLNLIYSYCAYMLKKTLGFISEQTPGQAQKLIDHILFHVMTHDSFKPTNNNLVPTDSLAFNHFFIEEITLHQTAGNIQAQEKESLPIYEKLAMELANLNPQNAQKLIERDFKHAKLLDNQFVFTGLQKAQANAQGPLLSHKILFWIEVCDFYRTKFLETQDAKYYHLMDVILSSLNNDNVGKISLDKKYYQKYIDCFKQKELSKALAQNLTSMAPTALATSVQNINRLNNVDANLFIIEEILKQTNSRSLDDADQELINLIGSFKNKLDLIQQPPVEFIRVLQGMGESTNIILPILEKYQISFDWLALSKRIESDIDMLQNLFDKTPPHLLNFSILDWIKSKDPSNQATRYTLRDNYFQDIKNFLAKLISTPFPHDELLPKAIEYRSMLIMLLEWMVQSIDENFFSEENFPFFDANDTMHRFLVDDYEPWRIEYLKKLDDAVKNPENPTARLSDWQETFETFCQTYADYANKFDEFLDFLEKFQKPSEGDELAATNEAEAQFNQSKGISLPPVERTVSGFETGKIGSLKIARQKNATNESKKDSKKDSEEKMPAEKLAFIQKSVQQTYNSPKFKAEKRAQALALAANEGLLQIMKVTSKKVIIRPLVPSKSIEENRKSLETEFPYTYKELNALLNSLSNLMDKLKYSDAAVLLGQLPAPIVKNIENYCSILDPNGWKRGMLNPAFNIVVMKASKATPVPVSNVSYAEEKNLSNPTLKEIKSQLLDIDKTLNAQDKTNLARTIYRLHNNATNSNELLVMLTAAQTNFKTKNKKIYNALTAYMIQLENSYLITTPETDLYHFKHSAALLAYAYNCEASLFKFFSKETEITAAYSIARILAQISLLIPKCVAIPNPPELILKFSQLHNDVSKLSANEKLDEEFINLLTPILEDTKKLNLSSRGAANNPSG